jgi:phosphonate transport system ATP-binding protein
MGARAVFELRGAGKSFGSVTALAELNLEIREGEQVALIGPSGAGKSTLIALLNGAERASSGEVRVLGRSLSELTSRGRREVQRQVGTVYQQFALVDSLDVIHNVNAGHLGRWSLATALFSLLRPAELATARAALARVGLADKLHSCTAHLSGGEQQRVALARVLVQDPRAVLADEPISSLDPERGREIMDLLRELCAETGRTLVTSCHSVSYVKTHFGRVIALRAGRLAFDCRAADLTTGMLKELYRIEGAPRRSELPAVRPALAGAQRPWAAGSSHEL